jgi:mersacidin/lichenicidin family type 2 lantibiotic
MDHLKVIAAWRDEENLLSLSDEERALLPANPAGAVDAVVPTPGGAAATGTNTWQNGSACTTSRCGSCCC